MSIDLVYDIIKRERERERERKNKKKQTKKKQSNMTPADIEQKTDSLLNSKTGPDTKILIIQE